MNHHAQHHDSTAQPVRVTICTIPVCGCGQDLDAVHGQHCPRCGTSLPEPGAH
jgi:hypothetical protein